MHVDLYRGYSMLVWRSGVMCGGLQHAHSRGNGMFVHGEYGMHTPEVYAGMLVRGLVGV